MRLFFFLLTLTLFACQRRLSPQQVTSHEGERILLGPVDRKALEQEPYAQWFQPHYQDYEVDERTLAPVAGRLQQTPVKIFMGTWCSDSQVQVPQLYKILDAVGYDERQLEVISLDNHPDRRKTSPGGEEKGWNIEYVPTFIFLKNGREVGRIVEYPITTLEEDIAKILGD